MSIVPMILFIFTIYRSDSIFTLPGSIRYMLRVNLIDFFVSFRLSLLGNVRLYLWFPLDFSQMTPA